MTGEAFRQSYDLVPLVLILDPHKRPNESQAVGSKSTCGRTFMAKNPE
jgi:hypothetical protein